VKEKNKRFQLQKLMQNMVIRRISKIKA